MIHHVYVTDHGEVRVSEAEAALLSQCEALEWLGWTAKHPKVIAKANWLRAACEQVARHRWLASKVEAR